MNQVFEKYFAQIEFRLLENPIYLDYIILRKDILYAEAKIRLKVTLLNSDTIELFEYSEEISGKIVPKKYSFHWQDSSGNLKMRWDNAPHYQGLSNFPHHIHLSDDMVKSNFVVPNILLVLDEIQGIIGND
jgi:hypothetical protein